MATYTIRKGRHGARPFRFGLWHGREHFAWEVEFTESCRYSLPAPDQYDINKLAGVSFLLGGVHKESARFGWLYEAGRIEIFAYCYVNGVRNSNFICFVDLNKKYRFYLNLGRGTYYFAVEGVPKAEFVQRHGHRKKWAYRNGLYFGGNRAAPHKIQVHLKAL